jgi:hypothetical protein
MEKKGEINSEFFKGQFKALQDIDLAGLLSRSLSSLSQSTFWIIPV